MGISTHILVDINSNFNILEILKDLDKICKNKNLELTILFKKFNNKQEINFIDINISNSSLTMQFCGTIYQEPYKNYISLNWLNNFKEYFCLIVIDYFDENEDILFYIVYNLLLKYNKAIIWIEENWIYTLDDLKRLKDKKHFNKNWCYINPIDF